MRHHLPTGVGPNRRPPRPAVIYPIYWIVFPLPARASHRWPRNPGSIHRQSTTWGDTRRFPLHLISNQPSTKLHSQLDHGSYSRAEKINMREPILLHPTDAQKRKLKAGDVVTVFNDRGACLAGVTIGDQIRQGVAQMSTGAWYDPLEPGKPGSLCKHGNPNVLTPDKGTSKLAQGPIALTCLVEVEIYRDPLPPVTAFDPPVIVER